MDKDNGKQYSSRWVLGLSKEHKINLGLNGGFGKVFKEDVFAIGADVTGDFKLTDKFSFDLQIEYKQEQIITCIILCQPMEEQIMLPIIKCAVSISCQTLDTP